MDRGDLCRLVHTELARRVLVLENRLGRRISHRSSFLELLVAERIDGAKRCRPIRGIQACEHADEERHTECQGDRIGGQDGLHPVDLESDDDQAGSACLVC